MTSHEQLAARLEAAEQGSRELSDEALLALGWKQIPADPELVGDWLSPDGGTYSWSALPSPTESVDDGLALLREMGFDGHDLDITRSTRGRATWEHWSLWQFRISIDAAIYDPSETSGQYSGFAATQALALSAALVRAHEAQL